ncbi:MAG: hypothetical protein EB084_07450 [Proteobacteria bacterium]|nr:hypothetical protein [Pseudomonadota bacterium]
MKLYQRIGLVVTIATITLQVALAARLGVYIGVSGDHIIVAHGNALYRPTKSGLERITVIKRPDITAMTVGPDGVFTAVGRDLFACGLDGSQARVVGYANAEKILALSNLGGTLWIASRDTLFRTPVKGGGAPDLVTRLPAGVRAISAQPEGVIVASGRTIWRVQGEKKTRITDAASEVVAVAAAGPRIWYACACDGGFEIRQVGESTRFPVTGMTTLDQLCLDDSGRTLYYSGWAGSEPRFASLTL